MGQGMHTTRYLPPLRWVFNARRQWLWMCLLLILLMTTLYVHKTGIVEYFMSSCRRPVDLIENTSAAVNRHQKMSQKDLAMEPITLNSHQKSAQIGQDLKPDSALLRESRDKINGSESESIKLEAHLERTTPKPSCGSSTQQVILLTYGRSGSSFTADIIMQNPQVLSHFEPLHDLAKSFSKTQLKYKKENGGKHLHLVSIKKYLLQAEHIVESWMTCNYVDQSEFGYRNTHMRLAKDTARLKECIIAAGETEAKIQSCLLLHGTLCNEKPIQFLKIIRLPVESVGRLMAKHPNLKMIFLMRDTRGSFLSKKNTFLGMISKNTHYEAERLCVRLNKDVREAFRLHHQFPGRVMLTRYESIAADPMTNGEQLLKFLCLDFTQSIAQFIRTHTNADEAMLSKDPYSVRKSNSTAASYKWRSTIPYADAKTFDDLCQEAHQMMGYLPVDSEQHLRDLNFPIKTDVDFVT